LPLDVIIGAIVIPTQAVILFKTEKVFISDFGKARKSWSKLQQEQMLPYFLSGLKAGDTVITSGVMEK
jgi:hypothetical protein